MGQGLKRTMRQTLPSPAGSRARGAGSDRHLLSESLESVICITPHDDGHWCLPDLHDAAACVVVLCWLEAWANRLPSLLIVFLFWFIHASMAVLLPTAVASSNVPSGLDY
jgi:hypothetical protein